MNNSERKSLSPVIFDSDINIPVYYQLKLGTRSGENHPAPAIRQAHRRQRHLANSIRFTGEICGQCEAGLPSWPLRQQRLQRSNWCCNW